LLGGVIVPLPAGIDPADSASLQAGIEQLTAQHFIFPFLAHALGTLVGAWLAARLGANGSITLGLIVGGFFLLSGIANIYMIGGPIAFIILDLLVAYLPMGWLGGAAGESIKRPGLAKIDAGESFRDDASLPAGEIPFPNHAPPLTGGTFIAGPSRGPGWFILATVSLG